MKHFSLQHFEVVEGGQNCHSVRKRHELSKGGFAAVREKVLGLVLGFACLVDTIPWFPLSRVSSYVVSIRSASL